MIGAIFDIAEAGGPVDGGLHVAIDIDGAVVVGDITAGRAIVPSVEFDDKRIGDTCRADANACPAANSGAVRLINQADPIGAVGVVAAEVRSHSMGEGLRKINRRIQPGTALLISLVGSQLDAAPLVDRVAHRNKRAITGYLGRYQPCFQYKKKRVESSHRTSFCARHQSPGRILDANLSCLVFGRCRESSELGALNK